MYYDSNILEEELKNKVGVDWFADFDTTSIHGRIDFSVADKQTFFDEKHSYLWAEAKRGRSKLHHSIVQLILTIGRARTFDALTPPNYLGAFDAERIGFVPFSEVIDIFHMNDFNWTVTPSDHTTREFALVLSRVEGILQNNTYTFRWAEDAKELRRFIKQNFVLGQKKTNQSPITKTNFIAVFNKWAQLVAPTIDINWEEARKHGILQADFYLADLLSRDGYSIKDKLNVVLKHKVYEMNRKANVYGAFSSDTAVFRENDMRAHTEFWLRYQRPPRREFWSYFIERRDLLVPQDVRERKGSYFTPRIWVERAHQYLELELGENWQDEYYVWDCAAGTGNLLVGLTNKYRIWASTLDIADVKVMHERIDNGANLLREHVFQFDFLNDEFTDPKLPESLRRIISDPAERRKLIILINPPYAEAGNSRQRTGTGKNKENTATDNRTYRLYKEDIKQAANELFAQFLIRIYRELPLCKIAEFSTLKTLQSSNFQKFRQHFRAKLGRFFLVPADTFDNVKGQFPIGFKIWHGDQEEVFITGVGDVFGRDGLPFLNISADGVPGRKRVHAENNLISRWLSQYKLGNGIHLGDMNSGRTDFQNQNLINIQHRIGDSAHALTLTLTNMQIAAIFFAVRLCISADWLNDRDQFLYPNDGWRTDLEFQSDCLAFTLFHGQNRITRTEGVNHWIPFTEAEVDAPSTFESHFMTDYLRGRLPRPESPEGKAELFGAEAEANAPSHGAWTGIPIAFSPEATAIFTAGRALWRYYMQQAGAHPDASLYDIRAHFQGFKTLPSGKRQMSTTSEDPHYTALIAELRRTVRALGDKIQPKVYAYGFLRE